VLLPPLAQHLGQRCEVGFRERPPAAQDAAGDEEEPTREHEPPQARHVFDYTVSSEEEPQSLKCADSALRAHPRPSVFWALPGRRFSPILKGMEVHFNPELEKKLNALASASGRGADDLVQDAVLGLFDEIAQAQEMLDSRYDDLKSGRVKPIDGEQFFESLRRREDELLKKHSPE